MKEVNLSRSNWISAFYKRAYYDRWYDERLPANLCPYFWKVVLAVICLPISWPGWLWDRFEDRLEHSVKCAVGLGTYLGTGLGLALLYLIGTAFETIPMPFWVAVGCGLIWVVIVIAGFFATYRGWELTQMGLGKVGVDIDTPFDPIIDGIDLVNTQVSAWYHGVCPHINWKD